MGICIKFAITNSFVLNFTFWAFSIGLFLWLIRFNIFFIKANFDNIREAKRKAKTRKEKLVRTSNFKI